MGYMVLLTLLREVSAVGAELDSMSLLEADETKEVSIRGQKFTPEPCSPFKEGLWFFHRPKSAHRGRGDRREVSLSLKFQEKQSREGRCSPTEAKIHLISAVIRRVSTCNVQWIS